MKHLLRAAIVALLVATLVSGTVGGMRWARRGGAGASLAAANALLLALAAVGVPVVTRSPQRGVEQAQEERDKTGGESGDPPTA